MKIAVARFVTVALLLTMSTAQSAQVIVNQSGDYKTGQTPILGTLRDAITNRASPGDTIVFRGRGKNVSIDALLTVPRNLVGLKIQGPATLRSSGSSSAGFFILADNVTIGNIEFRNIEVNVIDYERLGAPIKHSTITNNKFFGKSTLLLHSVWDCTVSWNEFDTRYNDRPALELFGTRRCKVSDNPITSRFRTSVSETDGKKFRFLRNTLSNGGIHTSAQSGLIFRNEVLGNRGISFESPDDAGPYGQLVIRKNTTPRIFGRRTYLDIRANTIDAKENNRTALLVENGDARGSQGPVLISENEIHNGRNALVYRGLATGAAEAEIVDNNTYNCSRAGIVLDGGAANLIMRHNTVTNCGTELSDTSIAVRAPILDNVLIEDNQTDGAGGIGLRIDPPEEDAELHVFDNRIYTSAAAGIVIRGTDTGATGQTLLHNNISSNNSGQGIVARQYAVARIEGGTVSSNSGAGFVGRKYSEVVVSGTSFSNNTGPGIDLSPNKVTPNDETKFANGDIDWPEDLRLDPVRLKLVGNAGRGEVVEVFIVEGGTRVGNPDNGEGKTFLGYATADQNGVFVYPTDGTLDCGGGEPLTTTATGSAGTSEFSPNLACTFPDPGVADTDRDGVVDSADQCPDTPPGAVVDASGCETDYTTTVDLDYASIVTLDPACNLDFLLAGEACANSTVEWPNDATLDCTNPGASVAITGDEQITGQNCDGFSSTGIEKLDCSGAACTYHQGESVSCEGPPGSCEITRPDGSQEEGCGSELECTVIAADNVVTSLLQTASITVLKETIGGDDQFRFGASFHDVLGTRRDLGQWDIATQDSNGLKSAKIMISPHDAGTRISINERVDQFDLTSIRCPEDQTIINPGGTFPSLSYLLFPGDAKTCVFTNTLQTNTAPVANAGPDQTGFIFSPIALDGSGSSDADGDALFYEWMKSLGPAGSIAVIEDPSAATTTFTPDVAGTYQFTLNVSDGSETSGDDVFFVIAPLNTPPVADAGDDQNAIVGELVPLAGAGFDPDLNDTLDFNWSFVSMPPGSAAVMNSASGDEVASFTPDVPGSYMVRLTVSDGLASSTDDALITVTAANRPPVADAGPDQTGVANVTLQLDGTGSTDPDGDDITHEWFIFVAPIGSTAALDDPTSPTPSFVPDYAGDYVFELTVFDGRDSATDQTMISVSEANTPPVADAGDNQEAFLGDVVQLIGAAFDPDPQDLEFTWTLESAPAGSAAVIDSASGDEIASFTPDVVGTYVARVTVTDGVEEDFADVQIRVGIKIDLGYAELESFDPACSAEALGVGQYCFDTRANFDGGGTLNCDQPGAGIGETDVQQLTGQFCDAFTSPGVDVDCDDATCTRTVDENFRCDGPPGSCEITHPDGTQEEGCESELECTVIAANDVVTSQLQTASITVLKKTVGGDGEFGFTAEFDDSFANRFELGVWFIATQNFNGLKSAKVIISPDSAGTPVYIFEGAPSFELTSITCPEDRTTHGSLPNTAHLEYLLLPGEAKTCTFTNTLIVDTDGDGFPDDEDKCPEYAGSDMGCAMVGIFESVTFFCNDATTCSISPGGSDCVNCSVEQNDGWWNMSCGLASETGGCYVTPGTDTGNCSNGCDIETPGISFHCGADASCGVGGSILDELEAQCDSAPDGSGCEGATDSGIGLDCPNGPCLISMDPQSLLDSSNAIRLDVNKNTIDGDGLFGFESRQTVGQDGAYVLQSHPFELQTIGGTSIWHSRFMGESNYFEVEELGTSSGGNWILESIDCSPGPSNPDGNSVGFATPQAGSTTTCTFTNRNTGTPPLGHQPLPGLNTLPEAAIEVSKFAFTTTSPSPGFAAAGPHDVLIAPHDVLIAYFDGFMILDPATGGANLWRDFFNTPYFGGIVLDNDQAPGADAVFTYGPNLWTYRRFIPGQGFGFATTQSISTTDFTHIGDDPDLSAGLETVGSLKRVRLWTPQPGSTDWNSVFVVDEFPLRPFGLPVSAFMDRLSTTDTTARVLLVTDGQPGSLIIGNPQSIYTVAVVGDVGNGPRRVRCAGGTCAVSNFDSDSLTIVKWDGGDNAVITATVNVGDGPVGIDLREVGDTVEIISTGFNDNTLTITTVASDGTVVESVTSPVESGCTGPGHALWLSGTNNAIYTCNTSDSYVVTSP